jgi:NADP-dependent 3-hydroxy acid dehydrogenase YdfG
MAFVIGADVTAWESASDAEKNEATLRPIDDLVNNAGVAALEAVHEIEEAQWDRMMTINVKGAFLVSRALAPGTVAATEMGAMLLQSDASPEAKARRLAKYPLGRFGEPKPRSFC